MFRTGGDELVAVVHGCDDARGRELAAATIAAVGEPVVVDDHELVAAVSIGVVCSAALPGADDDELLRAADLALYRAKADGRGRWVVYDRALQRNADHLRLLARDLEHAAAHAAGGVGEDAVAE